MARQIGGINGPFIGKAGSVIGFSRNGNFFIKGPYRKRKKPAVGNELLNQEKFAYAQRWLQNVLHTVRIGFHDPSRKGQAFVSAKSHLLNNAMKLKNGKYKIDPSLVKLSVGDLPLPDNIRFEALGDQSIRISWDDSTRGTLYGWNDQIIVTGYNIGRGYLKRGAPGDSFEAIYSATRKSRQEDILVGDKLKNKPWHIWVSFVSADRTRRSDSLYLGVFSNPPITN